MKNMNSPAYEAAVAAHNAAIAKFNVVRDAFRAGTAGADAFFAAKAEYDAATQSFDDAFAAEAACGCREGECESKPAGCRMAEEVKNGTAA
jgi:hypothetical protein